MKRRNTIMGFIFLLVCALLSPGAALSIEVVEYFDTYFPIPGDPFDGALEVIYDASENSVPNQTFVIMFGASYSASLLLYPPNNWGAVLASVEYNEVTQEYEARAFGKPVFRNLPIEWGSYSKGYLYYTNDAFVDGPAPIEAGFPRTFEAIGPGVELTRDFVYHDTPIIPLPGDWEAVEPTGSGTMIALCQGDKYDDGNVDGTNLLDFIQAFGTTDVDADINEDGVVDVFDLVIFSRHFGRNDCP